MNDTITMQLCNPRGYLYVDRLGWFRWGWEARLSGWHVDGGIARTKRAALRQARKAVKDAT